MKGFTWPNSWKKHIISPSASLVGETLQILQDPALLSLTLRQSNMAMGNLPFVNDLPSSNSSRMARKPTDRDSTCGVVRVRQVAEGSGWSSDGLIECVFQQHTWYATDFDVVTNIPPTLEAKFLLENYSSKNCWTRRKSLSQICLYQFMQNDNCTKNYTGKRPQTDWRRRPEMHVVGIWKCSRPRPGQPFCASLRSRNAHGHLARAIWCENLQKKCQGSNGAPWSNPGLYHLPKEPLSSDTLFGEILRTPWDHTPIISKNIMYVLAMIFNSGAPILKRSIDPLTTESRCSPQFHIIRTDWNYYPLVIYIT